MKEFAPSFWLAVLALAQQATRDHLTGLYNRRYFDEALADQVEIARRYQRELSLVLLDLNGFKQINDTLGHEAGDELLRQFSGQLNACIRKADIACRFGGDEFAVILPETSEAQALQLVGRLEKKISIPSVSFAAGVASLPCSNLMAEADAALASAKRILKNER